MNRQFWVLVERLSLVIFLGGLAAPLIGAWAGRKAASRPGAILGFGLGILVVPIALWFAMCTPPVGKGAAAERWYRNTAPLVAALEQYHRKTGNYPNSLNMLVPAFLKADALSTIRMESNGNLTYVRDTAGYSLRFEYHGPGVNHCTYQPRHPEWNCSGYY